MDPVSPFTSSATVPGAARVANTPALTPATGPAVAILPQASSLVDISPLGQMLSGLALSRRQLLALQGGNPDPAAATPNPQDEAASLTALAQQLADSFVQLRSSAIDTTQLPLPANQDDTLAGEFAQLSQPQEPAAGAAPALNQTALADIGIDLQAEPAVNPALLQAALQTDRDATLSVLQQTTDLLTQAAAALTPAFEVNADQAPEGAAIAAAAVDATSGQPATPESADVANVSATPQTDAQIQRQQEVQRQIEAQALTQSTPEEQAQVAQQERVDTLAETQKQQPQADVQTGLRQQADDAAAEAVAARAAAAAAQEAAQAATTRAQSLANEVQANQNPAPETVAPQPLSPNPPSSQDPAVAAAIAAYNVNNVALNPAVSGRQPAGAHPQKPAVTPVEAVTPVKPVTPIGER